MTTQQFKETFGSHPQFGQLNAGKIAKKAAKFQAGEEVCLVKVKHRPRDIKNRDMVAKILGSNKWNGSVCTVIKPDQIHPAMQDPSWFTIFNFKVA